MRAIDLNSDIGESDDPAQIAREEGLMAVVTSVNVACGVHAGSPALMRRMIRAAHARGVTVGAHPGFPDRAHGGRRELPLPPDEIERLVAEQVRALVAAAREEGAACAHVKPHGGLYGLAAKDRAVAEAVVHAVASVDRGLRIIGFAGSHLIAAGRDAGLAVGEEGFADRGYASGGYLIPRGQPGALLTDAADVTERALRLVREQVVATIDGARLPVRADTICVHGDTPQADRLARAIRASLEAAQVLIRPLSVHA